MAVIPADGEIFELTLDGDDPASDPIYMVIRVGYYGNAEGWQHHGPRVTGKQTRKFRLVGGCSGSTLDEVCAQLSTRGKTTEGQWREAFKTAYPKPNPDDDRPIGFPDPSWVDAHGNICYPTIRVGGWPDFEYAATVLAAERYRWLVEEDDAHESA